MKYIFFLLMILPFAGSAQDCKFKKDRDPYTKEVRISTGFITVGAGRVSIDANAKEIDVFFSLPDEKCFDDASNVAVMFHGTRLKANYKNTGTMNCEGFFHVTFRNTPGTNYGLQKMVTQKIGSIVFTSGKTVTTLKLTPEQMDILQAAMTCITIAAKELIPAK